MKFCKNCGNNLTYKIVNDSLKHICLQCNDVTEVENNCVFSRNYMSTELSNIDNNLKKYLCNDNTLPHKKNIQCPQCENKDVVYIIRPDDVKMVYYCCNKECNAEWVK